MVSQWRNFFHNAEMPFYYVQIAPWKSEGNDKLDWAWFRQCQLELMKEVPGVGMVTTGDAGSELFIHHPDSSLFPLLRLHCLYNLNKRYWHLLSAIYEPDFPNLPGNCNACNKRCPTLPVL